MSTIPGNRLWPSSCYGPLGLMNSAPTLDVVGSPPMPRREASREAHSLHDARRTRAYAGAGECGRAHFRNLCVSECNDSVGDVDPHGKADVDALVASIAANGAQTRCSDLTSVAGSITSTSGRLSSPLVATLKIVLLSGSCVVIIGKLNEQRGHLRSHPEVRRDDVQ